MFSGELNHTVYNTPGVLSGFKRLPSNVNVCFFIEEQEIDPKSTGLKELIEERCWAIDTTPFRAKHHFSIVDCRDIRIEESSDNNTGPQYARYLKARPDLARRILGDFKRSILKFDPGFDKDRLKF